MGRFPWCDRWGAYRPSLSVSDVNDHVYHLASDLTVPPMEGALGMSSLDYSERRPVSLQIGDCAIGNVDVFGVALGGAGEGAE